MREAGPLLLTTLVNRIGTIGLSLLPILIVQRGLSGADASFVLGGVKVILIAGILLSGVIADRIGGKRALLVGFGCAAIGFFGLPFVGSLLGILVFAGAAQFGDAVIRVCLRLVLTATVSRRFHKEAIGWLRTVNNFGQIFSYGLGLAAAKFGLLPLLLFDGLTAVGAVVTGSRLLPEMKPTRSPAPGEAEAGSRWRRYGKTLSAPIACAITIAVWNFYYELFMSGVAARLELQRPSAGLRIFSAMMVLNTVLCAAFAVVSTKWASRPSRVFSVGLALTVTGMGLAVAWTSNTAGVMVSMLVVTVGELFLGALAQLLQIRLLPEARLEGFFYSIMVVIAQGGRIVGAALAFPWIASEEIGRFSPPLLFWFPLALALGLIFTFHRRFDEAVRD